MRKTPRKSCNFLLKTEKLPPEGGLGAGAIVGISAGSAAVVGVGGFSLFWVVIKKKKFSDLLNVFRNK